MNPDHRTCRGIEANETFSINVPSVDMVTITDYCGIYSGDEVDKSDLFEVFAGELDLAPMIASCRLTAECRLVESVPFKIDTVYMGELMSVHADEQVLENNKPVWNMIQPFLFTFPDARYRGLGEEVARAWKVGKDFAK